MALFVMKASERRQFALLGNGTSRARPTSSAQSRFSVMIAAALLLAGCAAPTSYMGISFLRGAAAPDVQEQARRAQTGDKQAQLALGIRFESGDGVPMDLARARSLYAAAGQDTGGTMFVHVPRSGGAVSTVPINGGPEVSGLIEARRRLDDLEGSTNRRYLAIVKAKMAFEGSLVEPECKTHHHCILPYVRGIVKLTVDKFIRWPTNLAKTKKLEIYYEFRPEEDYSWNPEEGHTLFYMEIEGSKITIFKSR